MTPLEDLFSDPLWVAGFSVSTALLMASPWIITTIARLLGINF
jgi:hypothetical protein